MLLSLMSMLIAAALSLVLTPLIRKLAHYVGAVDQPDARKIHTFPIPRLGGMSIALSSMVTLFSVLAYQRFVGDVSKLQATTWLPVILGGMIVWLVGIWDDIRTLPAWVKFLFQGIAAGVAVWLGVRMEHVSFFGNGHMALGYFSIPLTFLWIVGITNAFNLIDGLDGLASGVAIIAASASATIFFLLGHTHIALLLLIFLGALLGFLPYNFHPAQIFLGDSGSLLVGYVLAVLAITSTPHAVTMALPVVVLPLMFGIPILDVVLSMSRRLVGSVRRLRTHNVSLSRHLFSFKDMFRPDRRHIHHRLLALGFSHRDAVLLLYALALALSCLAIVSVLSQYRNAKILFAVVCLMTCLGIHKLGYDEIVLRCPESLRRWSAQWQLDQGIFLKCVDVGLIALSYWGAVFLKYEWQWPNEVQSWYLSVFPLVLVVQFVVLYVLGLYRNVWRSATRIDFGYLLSILGSAIGLSYALVLLRLPPAGAFSFFVIDMFILSIVLSGTRGVWLMLSRGEHNADMTAGMVLIYRADHDGQHISQELLQHPLCKLRSVGFLDDDPALHGRLVDQLPVLGSVESLGLIVQTQSISCIVIASHGIEANRLHSVLQVCQEQQIPVFQARLHLEPMALNGFAVSHNV